MLNTEKANLQSLKDEQHAQNFQQDTFDHASNYNHNIGVADTTKSAVGKEWIELVTKLQSFDLSFVIYRLPQQTQVHMLICCEVKQFKAWDEIKEQSGFLLAPFNLHSDHPIILISPEVYFGSLEDATVGLKELLGRDDLQSRAQESLPNWANLTLDEQKHSYKKGFVKIQEGLSNGCRKLVLSRASAIDCPEHNNIAACFLKACQLYPNMMVTLSFTPFSGTWLGSTPETLLKGWTNQESQRGSEDMKGNNAWHTMSLAGTMAHEPELVPVERWSDKNRHEQHIVTEFLKQQLTPWVSDISFNGPHCVRAGHLLHLRTEVDFRLKDQRQLPQVLESIHPTPAVCGMPKDKAYEVICQAESYDRSYYAGALGLYNVASHFVEDLSQNLGKNPDKKQEQEQAKVNRPEFSNKVESVSFTLSPAYLHTQLFVNLRCMQFFGAERAICYAGGGILPESDVDSEFEETQNKMQTMQRLFENPRVFD